MAYASNALSRKDMYFPKEPKAAVHRYNDSGAPAADGAASGLARSGYIDCRGYDSVYVYWIATGGTSPTIDVEPLILDPDGDLWLQQPKVTGIAPHVIKELDVYGGRLFVRIDAVSVVGVTAYKLCVRGGKIRAIQPRGADYD